MKRGHHLHQKHSFKNKYVCLFLLGSSKSPVCSSKSSPKVQANCLLANYSKGWPICGKRSVISARFLLYVNGRTERSIVFWSGLSNLIWSHLSLLNISLSSWKKKIGNLIFEFCSNKWLFKNAIVNEY